MLLVAIVTGAKAADATFTITDIFDGTNQSATVTSPVAATLTTTAKASDAHSGKLGSDDQYFQIVLTSNKFTAASFNGYINTTTITDQNWAFQFTTNGVTSWSKELTQANDGTKSAHDITVGVTIPENANGIRIVRKAGTSSYVYSITLTLASEGPEISADNVNISEDGTDEGEIVFSVDKKGTTGTVTVAEKEPVDWLTLGDVDNTNGKVPFTAEANTAQFSRSAIVTLTYTYDTNKTATKEVTVTQDGNLKGESLIKATIAAASNTSGTVATGTIGGIFKNNLQVVE